MKLGIKWKPRTLDLVLFLLFTSYLIIYIDRVNLSTAAGAIKRDLGLSNTELGLAFSAYSYPYAILQLVGGWFADSFGPRLTLGIFGVIFSVATALTSIIGGLGSLMAVRALLGFGEAPALATATRAFANWCPIARWGFVQGMAHSFSRLGNAITPPFIALLITAISWRGSFLITGVLSLGWVAIWLWYFRDNPADHPGITAAELATLRVRTGEQTRSRVPVWRLFRRMLPVIATDFCYAWTLWVYLNWLPSFFSESYHLNLNSSALFTSGVFIAGIVGDTLGGVISDRVLKRTGSVLKARRNVIVGGMLGSLILLIPVLLFTNLTVVTIFLTLAFFSLELVIGPLWSVPMDISPRHAGTASGLMNFGFGIAGILSPIAFGLVIDRTGNWHLPFAFSIGLLLLGAAMACTMRPEQPFLVEADTAPPPNQSA
ncbi:MAG: MFS transporter [Azospirillaceae bacterium]|nr:MFS transporter [Azospirillaceae bacterium]